MEDSNSASAWLQYLRCVAILESEFVGTILREHVGGSYSDCILFYMSRVVFVMLYCFCAQMI